MVALGIPSAVVLVLVSVSLAACGASSRQASTPAVAHALVAGAPAATSPQPRAPASKASPSSTPAPGHGGAEQFKQALSTFATCLRSNGVQLPSASGSQALTLKGVNTKSPPYRSALAKCRPVLAAALRSPSSANPATPAASSHGLAVSPSTAAAAPPPPLKVPAPITAIMDRFTACMRSNGVPAFPEPTGAGFNLTGTTVNPRMPQYKAAQTHCNSILQALDPRG